MNVFAPLLITIPSSLYSKPWSFNLLIIACLVAMIPSTAVYLVCPSLIALIAACLIISGVSKSGSPALKL